MNDWLEMIALATAWPAGPLLLGSGMALIGGMGLLCWAAWVQFRPKKPVYEPEVVSDWRPTKEIDFQAHDDVMLSADEDQEAQFFLVIQEERLVKNIAGLPTREIKWRYATKAEAKEVVSIVTLRSRRVSGAGLAVVQDALRDLDGLNEVEAAQA